MTYRSCLFDQDCFQLIPSRFPPIDVYDRLGSPELRTAAQELEQQTNPRLIALQHIEKTPVSSHGDAHQYQNWNHAPFVYKNPEGSHFLGPAYGVSEMSTDLEAALLHALIRREEFFDRTGEEAMGQDMRVLIRRVTGNLLDLTAADLRLTQEERWKIGQAIFENGAAGIIYRRNDFGEQPFVSVFERTILGRALQGTHYRFEWDGRTIRKIYDFDKGETISRDDLVVGRLNENAA